MTPTFLEAKLSDKLIAEWNTLNIIEAEIEFLRESGEHDDLDDDTLWVLVYEEPYQDRLQGIFLDATKDLHGLLTNWITKHNPDGDWHVEVDNFGWRNMSGHKTFTTETGKELLAAVLPNTDCQFKIYEHGEHGLKIQNWHHDSMWGNEIYHIWPAQRCEWCGDIIPFGVDGKYCCEDCKLDSEEEEA